MILLLVVLTLEGDQEERCEPRHTSLVVQKMQGRAEVSRRADATAASGLSYTLRNDAYI